MNTAPQFQQPTRPPDAQQPDEVVHGQHNHHHVRSIASDAHDHWSSEQWQWLYRRFALRLVSLVRARHIDPGLTLWAFGPSYADLATWPDDERRATEDTLGAALVDALEHWPSHDLADLLDGLACASDDPRPWLTRLDAATGPAARGGVVRLTCHWSKPRTRGRSAGVRSRGAARSPLTSNATMLALANDRPPANRLRRRVAQLNGV
jgi:hypothetical protein